MITGARLFNFAYGFMAFVMGIGWIAGAPAAGVITLEFYSKGAIIWPDHKYGQNGIRSFSGNSENGGLSNHSLKTCPARLR